MISLAVLAALQTAPAPPVPPGAESLVTTRHQITLAGRVLRYVATAGRLPIMHNETGDVRAWMFFVSYALEGGGAGRPVTFAWNGGPGSNAGLIQLGGLGPRRFTDAGLLVDNHETWLDRTDLVFVDPVGTGFSRVTRPEYGADFYQTAGDAESVAEFVRVWRSRFGRWQSPVYLVGESFGVRRAAGVAAVLARRRMPVSGVVLIGYPMPVAPEPPEVRTASLVPSFTAAAWHHRRLGTGLGSTLAEALGRSARFAFDTLAPALRSGAADRATLAARLNPYLGVTAPVPDSGSVVPGIYEFARMLLADRGLRLGHYDIRFTAPMDRPDQPYDPTDDPSLQGPPPPDGVVRYLRSELRYANDLQYTGPFGGVYPPPARFRADWMSVRWHWEPGENSDTTTVAVEDLPLRGALAADSALKVVAVCGFFDLICSPAANDWLRDQLPPALRARVLSVGYPGGHATYLDQEARARMKADVFRFFGWTPR
ncbi:MAG: hypothetical protein AB7L66_00605 [Gemmatimonadales bacterium]